MPPYRLAGIVCCTATCLVASWPARADVIDGHWCYADGKLMTDPQPPQRLYGIDDAVETLACRLTETLLGKFAELHDLIERRFGTDPLDLLPNKNLRRNSVPGSEPLRDASLAPVPYMQLHGASGVVAPVGHATARGEWKS